MDKSPQLICGARGRACARRAHPRDRRWSRYLAAKLLFSEAVKYWTIVDPNPVTTFAIPNLKIVRGYVEDLDKLPLEVDCVVHSHTLEHMYDPARFFEIVRHFLKPGQLHIFSVPNLFALVAEGKPSLHFEHTILLREEHINWLLVNKGFEIVTMRHFGGKHSIFYVTRAVEQLLPKTVSPNFYAENRRVFQLWQDRLFEDVSFFKRRLAEDKKRNFIFAAHVATQYLLAVGLPAAKFAGVSVQINSGLGLLKNDFSNLCACSLLCKCGPT